MFLKILQNSLENTCARVTFLIKLFLFLIDYFDVIFIPVNYLCLSFSTRSKKKTAKEMKCAFSVVVIFAFTVYRMYCNTKSDQMAHMAESVRIQISKFMATSTRYDALDSEYSRLHNEKYFKIKESDPANISQIFAKNLHDLLESNKQSLINIKLKIEDLYEHFVYNDSIEIYNYDNERDILPDQVVNVPTFYPKYKLNVNQSNVQIPMNIYKYDKRILNTVNWTKDINKVFADNFNKTPTLLWQYFASKDGVMRTFPGRRYVW